MERVIGILDGKDETEKVEVLLDCEQGEAAQIHMRLLSWGEGIGWYPQKTINLGCRHLGALQTVCKKAEALLKTQRRRAPRPFGNVIPFPLNRSRSKTAPGSEPAVQEAGS
ncbi:MAG: hypothetical protein ACE5HN_02025 [Nitrospiria bacterium]